VEEDEDGEAQGQVEDSHRTHRRSESSSGCKIHFLNVLV
jgi:hypothetical protein